MSCSLVDFSSCLLGGEVRCQEREMGKVADQGGQCVCKREGQGGDCEGDEGQNRASGFAERKKGGYCGMFNQ